MLTAKLHDLHTSRRLPNLSRDSHQSQHTHTHTHSLSISRKGLIGAKAIRIDTLTVKSQLIDPLNNAVWCSEAVIRRPLTGLGCCVFEGTPKTNPCLRWRRKMFEKLKNCFCAAFLCASCQSEVYTEYLNFVHTSSVRPRGPEKALSRL